MEAKTWMQSLKEAREKIRSEKYNPAGKLTVGETEWMYQLSAEIYAKAYAEQAVKADREQIINNDPVKTIKGETIHFYTIDGEAIRNLPIELP